MLTYVLATLVAAAPSADVASAVTALVSDLRLGDVEGFELDADLAVSGTGDDTWSRIVVGLVRGRLGQLGVSHAIALGDGDEANARAVGAEWLLKIHVESQRDLATISAQLIRVDRGLWAPSPHEPGPILAIADRAFTRTKAAPPPPPPPTGTAALAGPAVVLSVVPGRVLAMGACRATEDGPDELVVVTEHFVRTYRFDRRGLDVVAELELDALPRSPAPSREPFGTVVCDGVAFGFGSSDLDRGYRVVRRGRGLAVERDLPGMPVGRDANGWVIANPVAGLSHFGPRLGRTGQDAVEAVPAFAVLADALRVHVVTTDYALVHAPWGSTSPERAGTAGTALAALAGTSILLHTADELTEGQDVVSLYSTEYPRSSVRIPRAVQALTAGRFRADRVDVLTGSWKDRGETEIRTFSIVDAPEAKR